MNAWLDSLLQADDAPCVLVTVAATRGSTPRETGARMVVWEQVTAGSIGGGNLEFQAIEQARRQLAAGSPTAPALQRIALGPSLGQCCGGVVELLFETLEVGDACFVQLQALCAERRPAVLISILGGRQHNARLLISETGTQGTVRDPALLQLLEDEAHQTLQDRRAPQLLNLEHGHHRPLQVFVHPFYTSDFTVLIFGAGHVGRALVPVLAQLPCDVRWIDSRADAFPGTLPGNVRKVVSATPEACADEAAAGAYYIVMTHDHALDQAICERILRRSDFSYCGLIGSRAKRLKFEKRLRVRGIAPVALQRLVCPIGVPGIPGKRPAEIAVAVAAQLLIEYGRASAQPPGDQRVAAARGE